MFFVTIALENAVNLLLFPETNDFLLHFSQQANFIFILKQMRERAKQNKLFIYIKIPQVPVRLSYKGNKEKNLEDITNVGLTVPNLEYHNVTWTWLDLLLAMKNDSRKVLLSQVFQISLQVFFFSSLAVFGHLLSLLSATGYQPKAKNEVPFVADRRETQRRRRKNSHNFWSSARKRRVEECKQIEAKQKLNVIENVMPNKETVTTVFIHNRNLSGFIIIFFFFFSLTLKFVSIFLTIGVKRSSHLFSFASLKS